ncbi:MAG TPA: hypothetical protein VKQ05_09010 [Gemmatimonadales bacterium]|nr:hypothetical protein [Gemmatimonadales bacterium]
MSRPEVGWQRRIITDRARARELGDIYRSVGFEVRVVAAIPEDFADACAPCPLVRSGAFQVIYTRRREGDQR